MGLGQDRWVLFVMGPKLGPAVLFWGVLIVIVILAIGLGKIPLTPLKGWHWFLLLLRIKPSADGICLFSRGVVDGVGLARTVIGYPHKIFQFIPGNHRHSPCLRWPCWF